MTLTTILNATISGTLNQFRSQLQFLGYTSTLIPAPLFHCRNEATTSRSLSILRFGFFYAFL